MCAKIGYAFSLQLNSDKIQADSLKLNFIQQWLPIVHCVKFRTTSFLQTAHRFQRLNLIMLDVAFTLSEKSTVNKIWFFYAIFKA
jgi:hypothetical protein